MVRKPIDRKYMAAQKRIPRYIWWIFRTKTSSTIFRNHTEKREGRICIRPDHLLPPEKYIKFFVATKITSVNKVNNKNVNINISSYAFRQIRVLFCVELHIFLGNFKHS